MLSVLQQIGKVGVVPIKAQPVAQTVVTPQAKKEPPLPIPNIHHLFNTQNTKDVAEKPAYIPSEKTVAPVNTLFNQLFPNGTKTEVAQEVKQEAPVEAKPQSKIANLFGGQLVVSK